MRTLTALLLLAGLAVAIPLRLGETWTWEVRGRYDGQLDFRTAMVIASDKVGSQTKWSLQIRDSTTKHMDTGVILADSSGYQHWQKASYPSMLPFEPEPWSGWTGTWWPGAYSARPDTGAPPWGAAVSYPSFHFSISIESSAWPILYEIGFNNFSLPNFPNTFLNLYSDPSLEVRDSIDGLLRARLPSPTGLKDWTLVSHDGRIIPTQPEVLSIPDSGATRIWAEWYLWIGVYSNALIVGPSRRWEVLSRPTDSSNWTRARIRESLISGGIQSGTQDFDLRWNRLTGERIPLRNNGCPSPDLAWMHDWSDSSVSGGRLRHFTNSRIDSSSMFGPTITPLRVREWIRNDESDSMVCENQYRALVERDGIPVRNNFDPISPATLSPLRSTLKSPTLHSIADLRQELSTHSSAIVRITDLSGRSRTFAAPEAMPALQARHGVVFVELKDHGHQASGRLVLP